MAFRNERVFYRFKIGDRVYRVKRAVSYVGEPTPYVSSGPYEIVGVEIFVRSQITLRRYTLANGGGDMDEEDLFYDDQAALSEAFLRNEKERMEHE